MTYTGWGPGDIYAAEMDRAERAELRRKRAAHEDGIDCEDDECEVCAEMRQEVAHEDGERCGVDGCVTCAALASDKEEVVNG